MLSGPRLRSGRLDRAEREPVNQRIRFKGPRRDWQASGGSPEVSLVPERTDSRADIAVGHAASAGAAALARPADEASWQASSYDLMSGLQITEFDDTVPGALLDDLGL